MMRYLTLIISFTYSVCVLSGLIQFHLWSQVEYLYNTGEDLEALVQGAHFSRYLLVYPIYMLADTWSISADYLFSLVCTLLIFGTVKVLYNLFEIVEERRSEGVAFLLLSCFLLLSLLMNGRIIFALFAMAVVLYLYSWWSAGTEVSLFKLLFAVVVSLWFSSVSSGTFVVIFALLVLVTLEITVLLLVRGSVRRVFLTMGIMITVLLALATPVLMQFLDKNITYFGGFWAMLAHGAGKMLVVAPVDVIILVLMILLCGLMFILFTYWNLKDIRPLIAGVAVGVVGGGFGFATLVMAVPPLVLILLYLFRRER